ncbi:MAG TPA: hypothetical protein VLY24_13480 [Bryobacteraceae bacterium]|nr:hypothetical protein [Bryobacteraceae bacterium]
MDPAELRNAVSAIRWAHRIDLGNGIVTPGEWNTTETLSWLKLPQQAMPRTAGFARVERAWPSAGRLRLWRALSLQSQGY